MPMTKPEAQFYALWRTLQHTRHRGLAWPEPDLQHQFHPSRAWRLDFAWSDALVAVEIEGGIFLPAGGRHNRGVTFAADTDKYNAAVLMGWAILRLTDKQLRPQPVRYTKTGKQKTGSGTNPVDLFEAIAEFIAKRIDERAGARQNFASHEPADVLFS